MAHEQMPTQSESQPMGIDTVFGLLERQAGHFGGNDLLVLPQSVRDLWASDQAVWSYADTLAEVRTLAARFAAAGYSAPHRIALLLENRPAHFITWLALNALGVSIVPINPDYRHDEIDYLLSHSGAVLIIRLPERSDQVDPLAKELAIPVIGPGAAPPEATTASAKSDPGENSECALIYTSGTTGKPKGCMLSNRYFLNWAWWYSAQRGLITLQAGVERLMTPLPTFHVNALGHSFMGMLGSGGAQIIIDRFHPRRWWETAVETRATCFHYLGVMPAILLELPESQDEKNHALRFGLGGGVHPDHHARFEARFKVSLLEGWAMTETGGAGTMCATGADGERHVGTRCIGHPGRPGPALESRLVDEDGQEITDQNTGELQLRAPGADPRRGFFSGYLDDQEATEAVWKDGWLNTGDVMRRGSDGTLFFVDRRKNIIRRSGENIAAVEVETTIGDIDGVRQVAVTAASDPLRGEEVLAIVVAQPGADAAALAELIFVSCAGQLAYYKVPGFLIFVPALPTTSTQKIRKAALKQWSSEPLAVSGCIDWRERKQVLRKATR